MKRFDGKAASSGIAIGQIWEIKHAEPSVEKKIIDRVDEELTRFETARSEAVTQLGLLYEKAVKEVGEDKAAVFEVHQMLLADGTFVDSVRRLCGIPPPCPGAAPVAYRRVFSGGWCRRWRLHPP